MPTLNWIGKEKVVNHHHDVPFKVLEKKYQFSSSASIDLPHAHDGSENMIIYGDNLEALKALIPEFEDKVDCIYIDPPYNTGNEKWVYNDAVNDPKILRWLGSVVGKEGEDLSRHDKWLCMMYPRLKLLHRLLSKDGSIWISIDDNAAAYLRLIMDEIFGPANFYANIAWQKKDTPSNDARGISTTHEYIMVYRKTARFGRNLKPRTEAQIKNYQNQDNDPRGPWIRTTLIRKEVRPERIYGVLNPRGEETFPPPGTSWRVPPHTFEEMRQERRLWWGQEGGGELPFRKRFLSEVQAGVVPISWWDYKSAGSNRNAKIEIRKIFDQEVPFETPKPSSLIERILEIATNRDSVVLDSYAGSGTTGHAVLKRNQYDGGSRRFILVEMEEYAETITAERVRRVMNGYGKGTKAVAGAGGSFGFYTLGPALFAENGNLNDAASLAAIRQYVAYTEGISKDDQTPTDNTISPYLLGLNQDMGWLFHYLPSQVTALNLEFLASLQFGKERPKVLVIYADRCLLTKDFMMKYGIVFKKIPRDITRL
jgi:adenine-specific DNA-methyltransferase